jgi:hypothetical protein
MSIAPPQGSRIIVRSVDRGEIILIPNATGDVTRYFFGLFLLFWLGMWAIGFSSAFSKVMSGSAGGFLVLWLGCWSIGGVFALFILYRILRPSVAESLTLRPDSLTYDSGIRPLRLQIGIARRQEFWTSAFEKRIVIEASRQELNSLSLRETGSSNRLTVDIGARRVELARNAGEIEREWLYRLLLKRYGTPLSGVGT